MALTWAAVDGLEGEGTTAPEEEDACTGARLGPGVIGNAGVTAAALSETRRRWDGLEGDAFVASLVFRCRPWVRPRDTVIVLLEGKAGAGASTGCVGALGIFSLIFVG